MLDSIDHIQLAMPRDQETDARYFYGRILSLKEIPKPKALEGRGGVWFELNNHFQIHLGVEDNFVPALKAHPCFIVNDLNQFSNQLAKENYPVLWDDALKPVKRFYSHDIFKNRLEFVDRKTY